MKRREVALKEKKTLWQRISRRDFLLFALLSLCAWIAASYLCLRGTHPGYASYRLHKHNEFDQHTLQALAWREGRISLEKDYTYLELAKYNHKIYVSFPPTPTLLEFPAVLLWGKNTPNNAGQLLTVWLAMLLSVLILEKLCGNPFFSYLLAFTFFWGTQVFYLSLTASVWHQGQMFGLFFSLAGIFCALYAGNRGALFTGALFIGLAVGCRPFYFLYIPLFIYVAGKRFPLISLLDVSLAGLLPAGLFFSLYNYIRFGNFLNFGHVYLPYESSLREGIFNLSYFPGNLVQILLTLPYYDQARKLLTFDLSGTSVLLTNPILIPAFGALFSRKVPLPDKVVTGLTLCMVWFMLLLHFGNGRSQFGYRYIADIIPLLLLLAGWGFKRTKNIMLPALFPLCVLSIAVNLYGARWFYTLRFLGTF